MNRPRNTDDSGAVLILALILITVFAVAITALMSLADTSIRTTEAVRAQAGNNYNADGAAQAAISTLRHNSYNNDVTSASYPKCFGNTASSDTLSLPNFYPGTTGGAASSATVTCSPDPSTGAAGGLVPITASNKPGNAILTVGQNAGEDGLNIKALNNSTPFIVHGSVVSNSNIRVTNGSLQSNAAVYAHTGCSGTIVSSPAAACSSGIAADPNYTFELGYNGNTVPTYRAVPTATAANCPGKVMTFQPGYYDDAAALSALMSGTGSNPCKGSVWWFPPGSYYFDFHNSNSQTPTTSVNPLLSGSDVWTINDGQLLAGQPVNSSGAVLAKPTSPITVPGACNNPIKSTTATGVQFIFGGDSQFAMSGSADAEICGSYQSGRPPIAMYGLKAGTAPSPTAASGLTLAGVTASGTTTFGPVGASTLTAAVGAVDSKYASWAGKKNDSATLTATSVNSLPSIPAGSILNSASATISYGASGSPNSRTLVLTPGTGPAITKTLSSSAQAAGSSQLVSLLDTSTGGLANTVHSYGLSSLAVSYTVADGSAAAENVDAITFSLSYTPPSFRAEDTSSVTNNCLASTYTGGSAGQCAVISTATSYKGAFYIQGTTYTPSAPIDLTLSNISAQVLRFGVVARTLWIKETGAISYIGPVIEVPDNSPGYGPGGTVVYLNVYICEASSSCSVAAGKLRLRARVFVFDPTGSPSPPSRQISVQSWATLR